ncbi:MAG: carbohydrate ABC transporter permease [Phycisphaerales bacterium]
MNRRRSALTPWLYIAPAGAVLGVFALGAALQVVYFSCTRYNAFGPARFAGISNYARVLGSERFWSCLLNSITYLAVTPAVIALSLAAAIVIDSRLRGMAYLRIALFLPVVTPGIVAALAWRVLLDEESGLINRSLGTLGLPAVAWLTEHPFTLISAMMVTLWKGFGFYMMIFLAGLAGVPASLREAAAMDGAGPVRTFASVTLPSLRPSIALVAVVSSISALKVFEEVFVTLRGVPTTNLTMVPLIYRVAFEEGEYGMASAMGLLLFLVVLAFSLVNLRLGRSTA